MIDITFPPVHYEIDGGCNCPSPDRDDNNEKCKKCGGFLREEQKQKKVKGRKK
jgi:hypothetical protein